MEGRREEVKEIVFRACIELHAGRLLHSGLAAAVLIETLAPAPAPLLLLFLGGAAMAS